MTGWQGNEGGQGGWNQPPHTPQGGDPYNPDPYPYGPSGGTNQYPTGPYPAQGGYDQYPPDQYGQYDPYQAGGFPSEFGPPPPPRRAKLPMILGVLSIVIIVGAVIAIVLVNRNSGEPTASPGETSERQEPRSTEPKEPTSEKPTSPGGREGWQTVDNTSDAGLTYQVPPDWKVSDTPRPSGLDVDFTGTAEYGLYDCAGATYIRSFATSGDVQSREGADLDLNKTVTDFAKSFATTYFKDSAKVDVGTPEEIEIGGAQAVTLTAPIIPRVSVPKCEAAKGEVAIVGVLLEAQDKPTGVAMLVVVSDVEGGPDDPEPLPSDVTQDILGSVRVG